MRKATALDDAHYRSKYCASRNGSGTLRTSEQVLSSNILTSLFCRRLWHWGVETSSTSVVEQLDWIVMRMIYLLKDSFEFEVATCGTWGVKYFSTNLSTRHGDRNARFQLRPQRLVLCDTCKIWLYGGLQLSSVSVANVSKRSDNSISRYNAIIKM